MDNKKANISKKNNKGLVVLVVFLSLTVLGLICYIVFDKDLSKTKNGNNPSNNNTTNAFDNILEIGKNAGKVVALLKNGETKEIYDYKSYCKDEESHIVTYQYKDGLLYLLLGAESSGHVDDILIDHIMIGYIDLNDSKWNFNKLVEYEEEYILSGNMPFSVVGDYIYLPVHDNIYKYSIKNNTTEKDYSFGFDIFGHNLFDEVDGKILYDNSAAFTDEEIGLLDPVTGEKKELLKHAMIMTILNNNKFLIRTLTYGKTNYAEYNLKTNKLLQINDTSASEYNSLFASIVLPYNDKYVYTNGKDLRLSENGKSNLIKSYEYDISAIYNVDEKNIIVYYTNENGLEESQISEDEVVRKYEIINPETLETKEVTSKEYEKYLILEPIFINK